MTNREQEILDWIDEDPDAKTSFGCWRVDNQYATAWLESKSENMANFGKWKIQKVARERDILIIQAKNSETYTLEVAKDIFEKENARRKTRPVREWSEDPND